MNVFSLVILAVVAKLIYPTWQETLFQFCSMIQLNMLPKHVLYDIRTMLNFELITLTSDGNHQLRQHKT